MLRLAHRILTQGVLTGIRYKEVSKNDEALKYTDEIVASTRRLLNIIPTIVADNVASYWDVTNSQSGPASLADIPNCVPPFNGVFIEWNSTHEFWSQFGCYLQTVDKGQQDDLNLIRWEVLCFGYATMRNTGIPGLIEVTESNVKANGSLEIPVGWEKRGLPGPKGASGLRDLFAPALFACGLMNCKNVAKEDATETEGPTDKWLRRMKQPKLRYHVLNIEPMKQVLSTEGGVEHNGLKKALHICRGHFVHYSAEKPLFGKYEGTFWKPAHVRGSIEQGAVVKDYNVNPPVPRPNQCPPSKSTT